MISRIQFLMIIHIYAKVSINSICCFLTDKKIALKKSAI
ncbi:hypothetical protein BBROOKSOX_1096 [Bathymodiolus brooksi thiotrophic gill symbiont]|nr:hypothetical protein BBROOKSOX_1096 [Bathymodiolus brooksi thiotrophic gill symbiont]